MTATMNRAELRERTGMDDDVLEHLLKRDVIRPVAAAEGRGTRRRFGTEDVVIAAVMAELHRYSIGIAVLSRLADRLYAAVAVGRPLALRQVDIAAARANVDWRLSRITTEADLAWESYRSDGQPNAAVAVVQGETRQLDAPPPSPMRERIEALSTEELVDLDLYLDLVDPAHLDSDALEMMWELSSDDEVKGCYQLRRRTADEAPSNSPARTSWVTISLTRVSRRVWLST